MLRTVGSIDSAASPRGGRSAAPLRIARIPWLCAFIMLLAAGCRSDAYREVYTEKMAGRIRVLEDQLNEADYANEVLRQKLHRYEQQQTADADRRRRGAAADDARDADADVEVEIDRGADGDRLDVDVDVDEGDADDAQADEPPTSPLTPAPRRRYPPVQPVPPRADDLQPEDIDLGEPLPPGGETDDAELPPGQIPTPESARLLAPPVPESVSIHTGLSGRHHHDSDGVEDGLFLVLSVADAAGNPIRCEEAISVVVLDPERSGEEARLGRWNFSAEEVAAYFREHPLPSIQLPILWREKQPSGESMAIFVRVMTDADQPLETDMLLELKAGGSPQWAPRGLEGRAALPIDRSSVF